MDDGIVKGISITAGGKLTGEMDLKKDFIYKLDKEIGYFG